MSNKDVMLYLIRGTERPAGMEKAEIASLVWSFQENVGDIGYGFSSISLGKVYSENLERDLRNWTDTGLLENGSGMRQKITGSSRLRVSDFGEKYLDTFGNKNIDALRPGYIREIDLFLKNFRKSAMKRYKIVL